MDVKELWLLLWTSRNREFADGLIFSLEFTFCYLHYVHVWFNFLSAHGTIKLDKLQHGKGQGMENTQIIIGLLALGHSFP